MPIQVIPDFFTSLSKLSKADQRRVRNTINLVTRDYDGSGLRLHKINHPSDKIFSFSVNRDIRIIVHRHQKTTTMLYVDHHDAAYSWIERRKFALSGKELRVIVATEINDDTSSEYSAQDANPFLNALKSVDQYKQELAHINNDDEALEFIDRLPLDESSKGDLLNYLVYRSDRYSVAPHYFVAALDGDNELAEALKYPLDLWRIFLHPRQMDVVSLPPDSSRYITGGPGTGKTVCLVHRIKEITRCLAGDQQVIVITYKEQLSGYILGMMNKIDIDTSKIRLVDVTEMNESNVINISQHGSEKLTPAWSNSSWRKNCFVISNEKLFYEGERTVQLMHIFVDEYQDFRNQQLDIIQQLTEIVPFTICVDYAQAIYRPPRETVREIVSSQDSDIVKLSYCYRLNDQLIRRARNVFITTRAIAQVARGPKNRFEVLEREEDIINSLSPALFGSPPTIFRYESYDDLYRFLGHYVEQLSKVYATDEIVITTFFPELYRNPQAEADFQMEALPESLQLYYRYIYTLKGLEWKAGIVVLDDTICSLLNINRMLLGHPDPEGFKGGGENIKRMLNLLYVSMTRFRDHLCICYPTEYALILDHIFE